MIAVTIVAGAARVAVLMLVEYPGEAGLDWRMALVAVDAFWRYLLMLFSPRGQSIFHAVPLIDSLLSPRAIGGLVGLACFVAFAWRLRRVHSVMSVGLFWFALLLVPSSGLLILGLGEPMAEHRVYLSAVGLFLTWAGAFGVTWGRADRRMTDRALSPARRPRPPVRQDRRKGFRPKPWPAACRSRACRQAPAQAVRRSGSRRRGRKAPP